MNESNSIQLFEDRKIRTAWDEEQGEWYFSVVDVIAALTESSNPTDYLKKMRKRDEQLASYLGTNCPQVAMIGATGKKRKVLAATAEQLLRIIQSIPSSKAEPFKLWLAQVGRERIEETIDPEQAIDRALETYQKKGYDTDWIHQRLLSIRVRNELIAECQRHINRKDFLKVRTLHVVVEVMPVRFAKISKRILGDRSLHRRTLHSLMP